MRLQFGTYNDGSGAIALQYFDAFRLQAAGPIQPTPTAMPTGEPSLENQMWLPYVENDSGR